MFDDLVIDKVHLPNEIKDYEKGWQTKSLNCYMDIVQIDNYGRLFVYELNKINNHKSIPNYHTGEIIFYQDIKGEWYEFIGFFDDGIMFKLKQTRPKKLNDDEATTQTLIPIKEIEDFFFEMGDDYNTWDDENQGTYPIKRVFDAMKNFIESKKNIK